MAQRRHPRPGYGYYRGGGHGGYYGHSRHGYYPYYRGYYPYYYPYASVYLGWPYYSAWPYYTGGYSVGAYYSTGYGDAPGYYPVDDQPPPPSYESDPDSRGDAERSYDERRSDQGRLRLEVRPEDTSVYVDGRFRGTAREARLLELPRGRHVIELVRPGYAVERHEVEIVSGERIDLAVEMRR